MKTIDILKLIGGLLLCAALLLSTGRELALAAVGEAELMRCRNGGFSTEEDFMMRRGEPSDGSPWISDGDLLSRDGFVCARNADLLKVFWEGEFPPQDLGLDAVDIIDAEKYLVAFSTELDHPKGVFTAGDLLVTNGAIIPNAALVALFPVDYDIGLDGIQFIGEKQAIMDFLEFAGEKPRDFWGETGVLPRELKRRKLDLWFTVEGTVLTPNNTKIFLDGDLVSVFGTVVLHQVDLLPPAVPAGIPIRGVDFGLDGVTVPRNGNKENLFFTTEIVFDGKKLKFTDGDVLLFGDGVVLTNWNLIQAFEPATRDVGLDALYFTDEARCENKITNIGGLKINEVEFATNGLATLTDALVPPDLPGQITTHPHGRMVPFWGTICEDVKRFRVVYRKVSDGPPSDPNDGTGIAVTAARGWQVHHPIGPLCIQGPWFSDASGWFDAAQWRSLEDCDDVNLTVWYSHQLGGNAASSDANDLYRVWLVFETTGGSIQREAKDHFIRLDNLAPSIPQLHFAPPADPECAKFGPSDMPVRLVGEIIDENFWGIRVRLGGDALPGFNYPRQNYYNPVDPGEFGDLDSTGTTPDGMVRPLRDVNVADLGTLPAQECCFGATVFAYDRSVLGSFKPAFNLVGGHFRSPSHREAYFAFSP